MRDELEAGNPDHAIEIDCPWPVAGSWDPDRLFQVLSNLAGNAIHHGRPDTAVTIRLEAVDAQTVVVSLHNAGAIPTELMPLLFEPFRGVGTKRNKTRGLGLGLFITQQIVRAHGGAIEVTSSESEGTTFRVRLPRG